MSVNNETENLKLILREAFSTSSPDIKKLRLLSQGSNQLLELAGNKVFIGRHDDFEHIYIFFSGIAYVVTYTQDGRRIIADTFTKPQIFGLVEAINGDSHYRATVVTLSNSIVFKTNRSQFLKLMYSDTETSAIVIKYLANLSIHAMQVSENKTSRTPYENLVIYLYNKCIDKQLPYRLNDSKAFIADSLQINKRSLYRYLNQLSEEGLLTRDRQDILITPSHFKNIERLFNSINDLDNDLGDG